MNKFYSSLVTMLLLAVSYSSKAQVSGTVFRDFNGNAIKDNSSTFNEPFVQGIIVTATLANGTSFTTTTDANGAYSFSAAQVPSGTAVRIEFSSTDPNTFSGTGNGTEVQFVSGGATNVNFSINSPSDYWNNTSMPDPIMMVVHEQRGTFDNAVSKFKYTLLQLNNSSFGPDIPTSNTQITADTTKNPAYNNLTGSTFGLAYQTKQERFFQSAYIKRMSGFGPKGPGGIYISTKGSPQFNITASFDLNGVTPSNGGTPLNFGTVTRTSVAGTTAAEANYLPQTTGAWTTGNGSDGRDNDAFFKVGKMAIGNLDIEKCKDTLFLVNMFERRLVVMDVSAATSVLNNASAAALSPFVKAYTLTSLPGWPSPAGTNDTVRPFGIKLYKGKGYLGVVSDASATQNIANLKGYILQFDPTNIAAGFTNILTINFNLYQGGQFKPWCTTTAQAGITNSFAPTQYPQPMISDIEFNENGSMDIAIRDRWGDQGATFEFWPVPTPSTTVQHNQTVGQGDLLHVCNVNGVWAIEGTSGSCVQPITNGAYASMPAGDKASYNNTGKEWYADMAGDNNPEDVDGGIAKLMGTNIIVSSCLDPLANNQPGGPNWYSSAGVHWNNVTTGVKTQVCRTAAEGGANTLDKANAIGDVEFVDQCAPIQIGNRLWVDANNNGLQDAGEAAMPAGITVQLTGPGTDGILGTADDVVFATTTTDGNGNYYFSSLTTNDSRKPATWTGVPANAILPGMNYQVRVPLAQSAITTPNYALTSSNTGANDKIDNDGATLAIGAVNYAAVNINTENTNHTLDFGFTPPLGSIGNYVWTDANGNGTNDEATTAGINGVTVYLLDASNAIIDSTLTANDGTGNPGYYLFPNLVSGTYSVQFPTSNAGNGITSQTTTAQTDNNSDANTTTGISPAVVINAAATGQDKDNTTIDAGYVPVGSIGNYVWTDANGNGTNDEPTTAGINGVTVYLLDASNAIIDSTVTANDGSGNPGYYLFPNLTSGTYSVQFPTSNAGNGITSQTTTAQTDNNSDANTTTGISPAVVINAAGTGQDKDNTTIDAGYVPVGSIGNYVWTDANGNGTNDEPTTSGINGVTVYLLDASNAIIDSTVTANDGSGNPGYYLFPNLTSGTYSVQFPTSNAGNGITSQTTTAQTDNNSDANTTTGISPAVVINASGTGQDKDNTTIDAGYVPVGSIGNYVWTDANGNGTNDEPTTAGINGVTVYLLDASNAIIDSTVTANDGSGNPGYYLFPNLTSGTYSVQFPTSNAGNGITSQTTTAQTDNNSDANTTTGISPAVVINASGTGQDKDNTTIDAGYVPVGSIGNYVWTDANGNGTNDEATTAGINGVTVYLLDASNAIIDSTLTANDGTGNPGYYLFPNLTSGTYSVQFPTSNAGNGITSQTTTAQTDNNSDANTTTGISPAVVINASGTGQDKDNTTIDAGYVPVGSIGNYVWTDANGNGTNDEPTTAGINGVTVYLLDASNAIIDSTVTANDGTGNPGYYLFPNLVSGTYSVQFPTSNAGNGITSQTTTAQTDNNSDANTTTGISPAVVINAAGTGQDKDNTTIDAGYVPLGSIGNYVWLDSNANGLNDESAAAALPGITVYLLDATNAIIDSALTDAMGMYLFDSLVSGTYGVQFPTMNGANGLTSATTTAQTDGNSDANATTGQVTGIVINAAGTGQDKDNTTIDAGYVLPVTVQGLGNYVWLDIDKDGIQDSNEPGVSGVTVDLYANGTDGLPNTADDVLVGSTTTDAYGLYYFNNLPVGDYNVGFTPPANYSFTQQVNVGDNQDNTNSNPSDAVGANYGRTGTINLSAGEQDSTIDAGLILPEPTTASVGDYVWFDDNADGIQDPAESGVSGVVVSLVDNAGNVVATTITDGTGHYLFSDVTPGTYSVQFTAPMGTTFTTTGSDGVAGTPADSTTDSDAGTTGTTPSFTVAAGDNIRNVDAGIIPQSELKASLGDFVWFDVDHDGIQDAGEPGIQGVTVNLMDSTGTTVLATTTTDATGHYSFDNLDAGKYAVEFIAPGGFTATTADTAIGGNGAGANLTDSDADPITGKTGVVELLPGNRNSTIDAGFYLPGTLNNIGNYVWNDLNADGIQDATEPGVAGVTAQLLDGTGTPVLNPATGAAYIVSTDANGMYMFVGLPDGNYQIQFSNLPAGFDYTQSNTPGDNADNTNSDANNLGRTPIFNLNGGETDPTVDAGIVSGNAGQTASLGNKVWYDLNNDGIQDADETGVSGVTATLKSAGVDGIAGNGDDVTVATTMTNGQGEYIFTNLDAGTYYVEFSNLPAGYNASTANAGTDDALDSDGNPIVSNASSTVANPVTLSAGEENLTVDLGINKPLVNSIGNYVWIDADQDGIQDATETPVPGVQATLLNADGSVYDADASTAGIQPYVTTTDANGKYLFTDLPDGTYAVQFSNIPSGYQYTTQNAGADPSVDSDPNAAGKTGTVTVTGGQTNLTLDAGIYSTTKAALGNYVWMDQNADGVQDATEAGIAGVLVTLYDGSNNPVATTVTDANGHYLFPNLDPGTYSVGFTNLPSGTVFTSQDASGDDATDSDVDPLTGITAPVTLVAGDVNLTLDAGVAPPATSTVGNYVWFDLNSDGIQDASEPPVAGVIVTLKDGTGTVVGTTTTDGSGHYLFTGLPAGIYYMEFNTNLPDYGAMDGTSGHTPMFTIQDANNLGDNGSVVPAGQAFVGNIGSTAPFIVGVNTHTRLQDVGIVAASPLSVNAITLNVKANTTNNGISWTSLDAQGFVSYELLKGYSISSMQVINTQKATASNVYTYTDKDINNNQVYYMVRGKDASGKYMNSEVKQVKRNDAAGISVYPNPTDAIINVKFAELQTASRAVEILDMAGKLVMSTSVGANTSILNLNVSELASGTYTIRIAGTEQVFSFIKN